MVKQYPLTCRASLSLPKQTASAAVQTACHLHTRSDSTRKQRNPFAPLALGLMKKIRYLSSQFPPGTHFRSTHLTLQILPSPSRQPIRLSSVRMRRTLSWAQGDESERIPQGENLALKSPQKTESKFITRTGAKVSPSCLATAGLSQPMIGTTRGCSSSIRAIALSRTTGADMA